MNHCGIGIFFQPASPHPNQAQKLQSQVERPTKTVIATHGMGAHQLKNQNLRKRQLNKTQ